MLAPLTSTVSLRVAAASHKGPQHGENEDCFDFDPEGHWCIVADGIGGSGHGAEASHLACDLLAPRLEGLAHEARDVASKPLELRPLLRELCEEFITVRSREPQWGRMGTTISIAVVVDGHLDVAWLGDSRVFLVRDGRVQKLTCDHTMAEGMRRVGLLTRRQAASHPWRNVLWKYVGNADEDNEPDVADDRLLPGDRLVLATDGVWRAVPPSRIAELLGAFAEPTTAANALVRAAMDEGSTDDATCIVTFFDAE